MSAPHSSTVRALAIACLLGAVASWGSDAAAADIHDLADRVKGAWKESGARVESLPPRFLFDDESTKLVLPATQGEDCVTVGIIGARGMSFHIKIAGVVEDPLEDSTDVRAASVAGVLELSRCKKPAQRIILTNDAGRGAVEIVTAFGAAPPPTLSSVLLERTGGAPLMPTEISPMPPLPPAEERARRADSRAMAENGKIAEHVWGDAENDGSGQIDLALEPGCHAIEVFAETGKRARRLDLDAEIRDEDGAPLARDRSEAADAHLFACVGEAAPVSVLFTGAPPHARVAVAHAAWALAPSLPPAWGHHAQARMASALRTRHMPPPSDRPVFLAQGASGETSLTAPILPGSCYVAVAAVTGGRSRGLGLRAVVGRTEANDDRAPGDEGGAVAFCTTAERTVRIGIDARGPGITWGLALFRVLVRRATP